MIIPYLSFQGNCEEAIALYSEALGGKLEYASRFTAETGSPALVGKIMHMEITFSDGAISGADQEEPVDHGKAMKLMIHYQTAAEANKTLEALAVGGQILQRLTRTRRQTTAVLARLSAISLDTRGSLPRQVSRVKTL